MSARKVQVQGDDGPAELWEVDHYTYEEVAEAMGHFNGLMGEGMVPLTDLTLESQARQVEFVTWMMHDIKSDEFEDFKWSQRMLHAVWHCSIVHAQQGPLS